LSGSSVPFHKGNTAFQFPPKSGKIEETPRDGYGGKWAFRKGLSALAGPRNERTGKIGNKGKKKENRTMFPKLPSS